MAMDSAGIRTTEQQAHSLGPTRQRMRQEHSPVKGLMYASGDPVGH